MKNTQKVILMTLAIEEFHKADNTEQKDDETNAKPQFIRGYHEDKKQTTIGRG